MTKQEREREAAKELQKFLETYFSDTKVDGKKITASFVTGGKRYDVVVTVTERE